ncbi:MAG: hypothetical protein STHCBS139747_002770 [Sporothrix thermara]
MEAPALNIPASTNTVSVSVVDSTSAITVPTVSFLSPLVKGFEKLDNVPAVFFLIEHASDKEGEPPRRLIFDLGVRSDWATGFSPATMQGLGDMMSIKTSDGEPAAGLAVEKDAHTVLEDGGVDPDTIEAIIWSHAHIDHTGNPGLFGPKTDLIIGPGFGSGTRGCSMHAHGAATTTDAPLQPHLFPGYPADPESLLLETDYKGRTLRELTSAEFDAAGIDISGIRALDYFGDGSFYLLDTPGHAPGHLCGLARVRSGPAPEDNHFVLMLGDAIHHMAEMRPNPYKPLPAAHAETKLLSHFPESSTTAPLFRPAGPQGATAHLNPDQATAVISKLAVLDAHSNVFCIAAHEKHTFRALQEAHKTGPPALFPGGTVDDFVARGFVEQTQWTFLKDLAHLE